MDTNRKVEFSVLLPQSESKKISYAGIDDAYHHCGHDENGNNNKSNSNNRQQHRKDIQPWKTVAIVSIILLVGLILAVGIDPGGVVSSSSNPMQWKLRKNSPRCQFCDQSPPTLHHNKSYTIKNVSGIDNGNGNGNGNDNGSGGVQQLQQQQQQQRRLPFTKVVSAYNPADDNKAPMHLDTYIAPVEQFYYTFVDLYLMAFAKCITYNKGGFGHWAMLIGGSQGCTKQQFIIGHRIKNEEQELCHFTTGKQNERQQEPQVGTTIRIFGNDGDEGPLFSPPMD